MDATDKPTEAELSLYQDVGELARFINQAHLNLAEDLPRPDPQGGSSIVISADDLPSAHEMLNKVTEDTEAATNAVMTHAETTTNSLDSMRTMLAELAATTPDSDQTADLTRRMTTAIDAIESAQNDTIMAMSFQDLTGQKIKQVIYLMNQVEERILKLVVEYGIAGAVALEHSPEESRQALKESGPSGLHQTNVDDILAEFGF